MIDFKRARARARVLYLVAHVKAGKVKSSLLNLVYIVLCMVKVKVKVKVKFALEQAMKTQRGSRGIAPLFL